MKFFQNDYIKNFPDLYAKEKDSNNYKILQLLKDDEETFRNVLKELYESLDIRSAAGYTLNLYGEMYEQERGRLTDEQYRYSILNAISSKRAGCDHNSIIKALSTMIGVSEKEFHFEDSEKSGNVDIKAFPYDYLQEAGITVPQVWRMVESLLGSGIRVTGMNITQEIKESELLVATILTLSENCEINVKAIIEEKVDTNLVICSAITHGENYVLEVVN